MKRLKLYEQFNEDDPWGEDSGPSDESSEDLWDDDDYDFNIHYNDDDSYYGDDDDDYDNVREEKIDYLMRKLYDDDDIKYYYRNYAYLDGLSDEELDELYRKNI